jgi:hypothetical protein
MAELDSTRLERLLSGYREAGSLYGRDLAKALLLSVSRDKRDRAAKVAFSSIVLRELEAAVRELQSGGVHAVLIGAFDRAARQACRDELLAGIQLHPEARKAA